MEHKLNVSFPVTERYHLYNAIILFIGPPLLARQSLLYTQTWTTSQKKYIPSFKDIFRSAVFQFTLTGHSSIIEGH